MWQHEHQAEAAVSAQAVWQCWADVAAWPSWNPDVHEATIDGPFTSGAQIRMTLGSGDVVPLTVTDVDEGRSFVDEASLDGVVVRTTHRVEPAAADRVQVVYAITVDGAAPDDVLAEIGTGISADFPETVAALLEAAAS